MRVAPPSRRGGPGDRGASGDDSHPTVRCVVESSGRRARSEDSGASCRPRPSTASPSRRRRPTAGSWSRRRT